MGALELNGSKPSYLSKTLWVNFLAAVFAIVFPPVTDWIAANPEAVISIFAGINILLRIVTKDKVQLW